MAKKIPKSWKEIPVGAAIFSNPKVYKNKHSLGSTSYCTKRNPPQMYGHVGIYIGNGQVTSWLGSHTKVQSWESWVEYYGNGGYGYLATK